MDPLKGAPQYCMLGVLMGMGGAWVGSLVACRFLKLMSPVTRAHVALSNKNGNVALSNLGVNTHHVDFRKMKRAS